MLRLASTCRNDRRDGISKAPQGPASLDPSCLNPTLDQLQLFSLKTWVLVVLESHIHRASCGRHVAALWDPKLKPRTPKRLGAS